MLSGLGNFMVDCHITHDTKCNDRFCPQSHARKGKAFEQLLTPSASE